MMYWVNGEPGDKISLQDRSFQYGDGCFTTILTRLGEPQNWPLHKARMQSCLTLLNINIPDWLEIENWVNKAALNDPLAGIKLHISRGSGGRGYSPIGANRPVVTINSFVYPAHYLDWQLSGVKLGVCQRKLGLNPMLAGHKHNNRLEQVLLKAETENMGVQDALVSDIQGNIIETSVANLFWVKGNTLYTPDLSLCGVAGTIRRLILDKAKKLDLTIVIDSFNIDHISNADEIFITNALLGVAPVIQIGDLRFNIGKVTRRFQEKLSS